MTEITLHDFCEDIIAGTGGLRDKERYEMMIVVGGDRDVAVADWVIRCLANPHLEGSEYVLEQIQAQRARVLEEVSK